ncbi:MAG: 1,4-dihydroxy-2-naphthoate polyprenyltransferase [Actinobacteria bacterium]|nr:1,4-dihydroxy-2-naphthoate polyprenyltransferase [Actinomycetota bacterium]
MNIWIQGSRPRTLPAAIAPVLVATVAAGSQWRPLQAALALFVSLALQVGVNYSNDYSDGIRGTDDNRIGPTRLTASGLATAQAVKNAAFLSFGAASIAGLVLASLSSWWVILIGITSIAAAWGYTGGANPYGYKGLGEVSVFIFFGVVATVGTYYVQTLTITWLACAASVPMGALACALLAINNIRDRAQDVEVGKKTLAVRLGDRNSRLFLVVLLTSAYLFAALTLKPWALITVITLPLAVKISRAVLSGAVGRDLIPLLAKTGQLQLLFALTFALGLAL